MRFCKIDIADLNQEVFDSVINNSLDSCIHNQEEQIAVVCWEGNKPSTLTGKEEINQQDLATLIVTKHNGWTTPIEVTPEEAKQLPDEILAFLSYTPDEIAAVRAL